MNYSKNDASKPHAVFKYFALSCGFQNVMYEMSVNPNKMGWILTKDEAKKYIKKWGLVMVHKNKYGEIWDTPDKAYLNKFKGFYKRQSYERDIHQI